MSEQDTRHAGEGGADGEGLHLVAGQVDAHALARGLRIADRDEGAAGGRAQQVQRQQDRSDEDQQAEEVEGIAVARDRLAKEIDRADPHALVAVRDRFPARQDFLDDEGEGDGGDHEVDAAEPQGREADHRADGTGDDGGRREIDDERYALALHEAGGVGTDGEEGGVAKGGLPGEARQDDQRHADDGVDEDEHHLALEVAADQIGRGDHHRQQHAVGPPVAAVLQQLDVLVVVGLEDETHGLRPSCACWDRTARAVAPAGRSGARRRGRRPSSPAAGRSRPASRSRR